MPDRPPSSAAQALFGHLPHDDGRTADWAKREHTESVGAALFPSLVPKPKPPPASQRQTHEEEAWRDWSGVDPRWAQLVGLVRR